MILLISFFFSRSRHHRALHSFPTRRSSDLFERGGACDESLAIAHELEAWVDPDPPNVGEVDPRFELVRYGERSEEHTSELQSRFDLVCRLLLEKKKKKKKKQKNSSYRREYE